MQYTKRPHPAAAAWSEPVGPLTEAYRAGIPDTGRDPWIEAYCEHERILERCELNALLDECRQFGFHNVGKTLKAAKPGRKRRKKQVPVSIPSGLKVATDEDLDMFHEWRRGNL